MPQLELSSLGLFCFPGLAQAPGLIDTVAKTVASGFPFRVLLMSEALNIIRTYFRTIGQGSEIDVDSKEYW